MIWWSLLAVSSTLSLSRADVIRLATLNPQVKATAAEIARGEARRDRAHAARFPRLSATAFIATSQQADLVDRNGVQSVQSSSDFSLSDLSAAFGGTLDVIQPLFTFGKIDLRAEAAEHGIDAAKSQVDITRDEVAFQAASLCEASLYAGAVQRFMSDVSGILVRSIEDTEARLEAGALDVSRQDLLRLQSALGAARVYEHAAEAAVAQTSAGLRAYLDLAPATSIALEEDELVADRKLTLDALIALAREHRPELRALRSGATAFDKLADAEEAGYFPDIFLYAFVSGAYTPGRDWVTSRYVLDPLGHFVPGALLGARWELDWNGAGARADEARADAGRLQSLLAWAERGIPAEVEKLYRDLLRIERDAAQLRETVPITKEWTVRASADYAAALGDSRAVTDAVEAYVLARSKQLETTYLLNVTMAALAKATGTLRSGSALYPGERR
jgi:outer membrane protein TolC